MTKLDAHPIPQPTAERTRRRDRAAAETTDAPATAWPGNSGLPRSTVGAVLRRLGLGRLKALDPPAPVVRYQREQQGELLHMDTKKLGRIAGVGHRITGQHSGMVKNSGIGWEVLHVCIDDASRLAYTELLPDEKKESAIAFLDRALAWFDHLGVTVERVMTDNWPSAYRSHAFRGRLKEAEIRHIRTRPYTPKTNGKAERFIQTSLREWAYARAYQSSAERGHAMLPWIAEYNRSRPHSALAGKPPLEKLNNVLGFDTATVGHRRGGVWQAANGLRHRAGSHHAWPLHLAMKLAAAHQPAGDVGRLAAARARSGNARPDIGRRQ